MKKENRILKTTALASGAALLSALGTNASAAELLNYESLGDGAELRTNLLTADAVSAFTSNTDVEFECGEGKCGEGKCGEGKCGEDHKKKDDKKKSTKAESTTKSSATTAQPAMKKADGDSNKKKSKKNSTKMEAAPKD